MEGLERLRERYNNMLLAHASFERELKLFAKYDSYDHELYRSMRNSIIKTFELAIDPLWKFLRDYMTVKHGLTLENPGPKLVYREAARMGIILKDELPIFIDMVEDRNETVHIYKELIAESIKEDLPSYCKAIGDMLERLKFTF